MALDRSNITPVDDDGTGTKGTVLDAAFFDAVYDAIDAYAALLGPSEDIPLFAVAGPTQLRTYTFPDADATVFTSAGIANDALKILDTDDSHYLFLVPGSNLSADRTFTLVTGDADRTLTLSGNPTLGDWFDQNVKAASSPTFAAITIGSTAISETDIAKIDGITNGTAAAGKAVVLDASADLNGGLRNFLATGNATFRGGGSNESTVGIIRLPNNFTIGWRNAANNANIELAINNGDALVTTAASFAVGTTSATAGAIRIPNNTTIAARNAGNSNNVTLVSLNTSDVVVIAASGGDIQWGRALVALGGGSAPTLGTIGGSGPATAGQNAWMRVLDSAGVPFWVPIWK